MNCQEALELLGPYLDGELDAARCAEIEKHLAGCKACTDELDALRQLSRTIREKAPYFTAPASLRPRVAKEKPVWIPSFAVGLAAGIALMLAFWRPWTVSNPLVGDLVGSHIRSMMGNDLVEVTSSDRHTVKPWFQGKIDFSPIVVDLASQGFPLVGGRLEYLEGRRVAALVYKRRLHTINVFVGPQLPGPTTADQGGFHVRHWDLNGLDYWGVTDANAADLTTFESDFRDAAKSGEQH